MSLLRMERRASDNPYLHKDFHAALSTALDYLRLTYGETAVRDFLHQFARAWYQPLREKFRQHGLPALREHYARIFSLEGGEVTFLESTNELQIVCKRNPAVLYLRERGTPISPLFHETVATVGQTLCDETDWKSELLSWDPETGAYRQRFFRKPA